MIMTQQSTLPKARGISMTMAEALEVSRVLANKVEFLGQHFHCIVGVGNGSLLPAQVIASALHLPLHIIRLRRKGSRLKKRFASLPRLVGLSPQMLFKGPFLYFAKFLQNRTNSLESEDPPLNFLTSGMSVLLVDDCIDTGRTIELAKQLLLTAGASTVRVAVLSWLPAHISGVNTVVPDLYLYRYLHRYPWSSDSPDWHIFVSWLDSNELTLWV